MHLLNCIFEKLITMRIDTGLAERCVRRCLFILSWVFPMTLSFAQGQQSVIEGTVTDSLSSKPLPYATISVLTASDSKLVTGAISDDAGKFAIEVKEGDYYIEISFIGYRTFRGKPISAKRNEKVSIGNVRISPNEEILQEVTVRGEKSTMELMLDKKVFNVGKDLANSGGTASDILTNIPSVAVDAEGNVRLRGSDNVRILIDGKPSGLVSFKGGSGLQQMQASMVERVEVITNPSARYEAEGLGGVINIILKKEQSEGFNGSIDVIAGNPHNFGVAANLNYRHKKINFFINYGLAYREQPGRSSLYQEVYDDDTTFILQQNNRMDYGALNNNIRGGVDLFLGKSSILTGSYLYRGLISDRTATLNYNDYANSLSNLIGRTTRTQDEEEKEPNSEYALVFKKTFPGKDHELISEVKFLDNREESDQDFMQYSFAPDGTENEDERTIQKSINVESEKQYLVQVDYTKPFATSGRFETGVRSSLRKMDNDFWVRELDEDGIFQTVNGLDNVFLYDERIAAAYAILGNKNGRFSYQAGLRSEWTDVETVLEESGEKNPRKYHNLFPSAHFTFDLGKENNIQLSYSRRIRRPTYNDLSPFFTFSDSRNYAEGNPNLDPEFSNVFEIGYLKTLDLGSVSASVYNRRTTDRIDRIRLVQDDGNAVTRPENLRSEIAYGVELTTTYEFTKWWKWDANFNFFHADIDGTNLIASYQNTTYSWFARQTSKFSLPGKIEMQVRTNYEAPQKTVQGRRKSLYYADFSLSKDVLKGNGTVNLNVLDVFNTRRMRTISEGEIFYSAQNSQFRRRQVNLTFSLRINKNKATRRQQREAVLEE
jgi:ferric enterobactin receptor